MKKMLIVPAVIIAMLAGQIANAQLPDPSFSDVGDGTSYASSILWMAHNGVIQGYPDGTFKPDQCVNRSEFLKMLYLTRGPGFVVSDGVYGINFHEDRFSDTYTDQWYWPYVNAALEEGLVEGYPDGTFKPGQCVNRVEAIKMGLLGFYDGGTPSYIEGLWGMSDVDRSQWYGEYVAPAIFNQLVGVDHVTPSSVESYKFYPGDSMSRKEVAEMLFRISVVVNNNLDIYSANKPPKSVNYYRSPNGGASFIMPTGWEVTSDVLYETPGGAVAEYPWITFNGPNDQAVAINQRQMACGTTGTYDAYCHELSENYTIGAFDPGLAMLQMMELVKLTFNPGQPAAEPIEEVAFDGCGAIGDYSQKSWFTGLVGTWDQAVLDEEIVGIPVLHDPFDSVFGEGCLALDDSLFIFIPAYMIDGSGKIFSYNTVSGVLTQAESTDSYAADEFGPRIGNYVTVYGVDDYYGCEYTEGHFFYNENRFEKGEDFCTNQ